MLNIRGKTAQGFKNYLDKRAKTRLMKNSTIASVLRAYSPSTGCDYTDYWTLYSYIRENQPMEVLELGAGISTAIMAEALRENGKGRLTSLEEAASYHQATLALIPESLKSLVDLRLSPPIEARYGPFVGVRYKEIPDRPYDMVFVDGPHYDAETSFDADILFLLAKSETPITAFIDSRTGSCFIYHLALGDKLKFSYLRRVGFIDGATRHDLKTYRQIVAEAMKKRAFKRI